MIGPRSKLELTGLCVPGEVFDIDYAGGLNEIRRKPRDCTITVDNHVGVKQVLFAMVSFVVDAGEKTTISDQQEINDSTVTSGAPNENIVQNHLDIALLNVF